MVLDAFVGTMGATMALSDIGERSGSGVEILERPMAAVVAIEIERGLRESLRRHLMKR